MPEKVVQYFDNEEVFPDEIIKALKKRFNVLSIEDVFKMSYKHYHNAYHDNFECDAAAERIKYDLEYFYKTNKLPFFVLATYFPSL